MPFPLDPPYSSHAHTHAHVYIKMNNIDVRMRPRWFSNGLPVRRGAKIPRRKRSEVGPRTMSSFFRALRPITARIIIPPRTVVRGRNVILADAARSRRTVKRILFAMYTNDHPPGLAKITAVRIDENPI